MIARSWIAVLLVAIVTACSGEPAPAPPAEGEAAEDLEQAAPAELPPEEEEQDTPDPEAPLDRVLVAIYFPAAYGNGLVAEEREIFHTVSPVDRAKQILSDLVAGPTDPAGLKFLPPGTRVRQVYVLRDGTAFADFSSDLPGGIEGGSENEILTIYAIVNSLVLNVPEIVRVGILVDGWPCETLNGHLDLRRPLPPEPALILSPEQNEETWLAEGPRPE